MKLNYRPEIDGLRAIAVLAVIFYHAGFGAVSGGFVGVDIFFVISGFLITSILVKELSNGTFSLSNFYERRARRILPPVLFMAVVVTPIALFVVMLDFAGFTRSLAAMATFWANIFFYYKADYFDVTSEFMPFLHTWSLSVEEQFYLVFPLALLLMHKVLPRRLLLCVSIATLVPFLCSMVFIIHSPSQVFYLTHFRAWELLIGAIVALMRERKFSQLDLLASSTVAICLLFIPMFMYNSHMRFPGFSALPPCLGAAILIYVHKNGIADSVFGKILAHSMMVNIGKISYSLYLWHWPVFVLYRIIYGRISFGMGLVLIAVVFVLAIISTKLVEMPIRSKQLFNSKKTIFTASICSIVVMVAVSQIITKIDIPFREEFKAYISVPPNPYNRCLLNYGGNYTDLNCRIGDREAKPSFIIWGDSHAASWTPALNELATQYGRSGYLYAASGCDATFDLRADNGDVACQQIRASVIDIVKENGLTDVIFAHLWHKNKNYNFASTFDAFHATGAKIWYVEDVPNFYEPVPQILLRNHRYGVAIEPFIAQGIESYQQNHLPAKHEHVTMLTHKPRICTESTCVLDSGTEPYYMDKDHLSVAGSIFYKDTFLPIFENSISASQTHP